MINATSILGMVLGAICMWICAISFVALGLYAGKRKDPMWFWSGSVVQRNEIRDIPRYNLENRNMWLLYSIPYWIGGVAMFFNITVAISSMVFACTIGIVCIVVRYNKIYKKYKR